MDIMTHNLSFDIKIPEGHYVRFEQDATFENFIGQFQQNCPKLMCVINGTNLRYYDNTTPLPNNIRFDYKQRRRSLTEYYFRDIDDDTLYCVFGREAATIFYPRIDEIDPTGNYEISNRSEVSISKKSHSLEAKKKSSAALAEDILKQDSYLVMEEQPQIVLDISKPRRLPIVQPIKQPSIPLFRDTPNMKGNSNNLYLYPIQKNQSDNRTLNIPQNHSNLNKRVTMANREDSNYVSGKLDRQKNGLHYNKAVSSHVSIPNKIVIIDQGVKLTFPNPNYPIEIKTYYPS